MNRALQSDLHPDAESLNAFMEEALAIPERARILDHIAGCSRCRQIVFLSQQAAPDVAQPVAVPASISRPEAWYRNWSLNWRLAWAPAAAFALIVALAVFVHLRRVPSAGEVARVAPPAQHQVPLSSPLEAASETPAHQPAPVAPLKSAKKNSAPARVPEPARELLSETPSSGAMASEPGAARPDYAEPPVAAASPGVFGQGAPANAPLQLRPEPAEAAWQAQREQADAEVSRASKAARTTQARLSAKMEQSQASRTLAEKAAPAGGSEAKSALEGSFEPAPARSLTYDLDSLAVTPKAEAATLPSGLAVLSSATMHHRAVAIDLAGALFVKEGSAGTWEPVVRQWTGRLVQVRVEKTQDAGKSANATAPPATATFAIVNAGDQVWTSEDGRTWKAR